MGKRNNPARPFTLRTENGPKRLVIEDCDAFDFDEFYVGDWFSMERMDRRVWWMQIGDVSMFVRIPADGSDAVITVQEGRERIRG